MSGAATGSELLLTEVRRAAALGSAQVEHRRPAVGRVDQVQVAFGPPGRPAIGRP